MLNPCVMALTAVCILAIGSAVNAAAPDPMPKLKVATSWVGNSLSLKGQWVQQDINAMHVTRDGTVYTNVPWDENGGEVTVYRDGRVWGTAAHTHGWGYMGGEAVTANSRYLFIAQSMGNEGGGLRGEGTWPPGGKSWVGVSRRKLGNIKAPAPFAKGKGGDGDTLKGSFLVVAVMDDTVKDGGISGLFATETRLYVASPREKAIKVYDAESMEYLTKWTIARPGPMCMDGSGTLWVVQRPDADEPGRIVGFRDDGSRVPRSITLDRAVSPKGMAIDKDGRLLVTNAGVDQNVLIFGNLDTKPEPVGTFGNKGGIFGGRPGEFGDLRFNMPWAIGTDGEGNVYINSRGSSGGGSTVLESYTPGGTLRWRLFGLEFVDMADLDPASEADLYTKEEHFAMDYSRTEPGSEWSYKGYTINPVKYPDDPRLHVWSAGVMVRRIGGKPFLFVNDMYSQMISVFRFDPEREGETAIPCAYFSKSHVNPDGNQRLDTGEGIWRTHAARIAQWPPNQPDFGEWIWRDLNGNGAMDAKEFDTPGGSGDAPELWGWYVDDAGDVWQATRHGGIRRFVCKGLDAKGVPIWGYRHMVEYETPAPFEMPERAVYMPATDTMYLSGYTDTHPHHDGMWKNMGRVVARYEGWSTGKPRLAWQAVPPYKEDNKGVGKPASFCVAGDHLFIVNVVGGTIYVYNLKDGSPVGRIDPPASVGNVGWVDIPDGIRAHRRADGEYIILVEEDAKAKILMYRWRP